jgi:thioredoxin 1
MSQLVAEITDKDFDQTIAKGVVLVDFWAPWCGPCRLQAPILDKVAEKVGATAKIVKVNVDDNAESAGKFGIQSIPTLIVFKDGKPAQQFVGVTQADALVPALTR